MSSAHEEGWEAIQGTYAMTASGNCLWSTDGFNVPPYPLYTSPSAYAAHFTAHGTWTFHKHGKGTAHYIQVGLTSPPIAGNPNPNFVSASSVEFLFTFTYVVEDGMITVSMDPIPLADFHYPFVKYHAKFLTGPKVLSATYWLIDRFTFVGRISSDHKTILLNSGENLDNPEAAALEVQTFHFSDGSKCYGLCNSGRVLTRMSE